MSDLPSYDDLIKTGKREEQIPSYDELTKSSSRMQEQPTQDDGILRTLMDTGIGATEGLTLGGAGEIGGAIGAVGQKAAQAVGIADDTKESLGELYRRYQQSIEKNINEAEERSPIATSLGNIAGGMVLPVGIFGSAAKGASALSKMGKMGAAGLLTGGLSSEGTIEDSPSKIAHDALVSGAISGTVGPLVDKVASGVVPAVSSLYKKTGLDKVGSELLENYQTPKQVLLSATESFKGRPFYGKAGGDFADKELENATLALEKPLERGREYITKKFTDTLQKAPPIQISDDLSNDLLNAKKMINASKINAGIDPDALPSSLKTASGVDKIATGNEMWVEQLIDKALKLGKILPQELKEIQKYARDSQGGVNSKTMDTFLESLNKTSKDTLEKNVPGYKEINNMFGDFEDVIGSFAKKVPLEYLDETGKKVSGTKLITTAEDVIRKARLPFDTGRPQARQLRELGQNLKLIQKQDPNMLKNMGIEDVDSFIKSASDVSHKQAVSKTIRSSGQLGQTGFFNIGGQTLSGFEKAAVLAGSTARVGKKIADIGPKLVSMSGQGLSQLAQKLSSNPSTRHMGEGLVRAIEQGPASASRNAVLFTILQNPNSRKVVQDMYDNEETEE